MQSSNTQSGGVPETLTKIITGKQPIHKDRYLEARERALELSRKYHNAQIALMYDLDKRVWTTNYNANCVLVDYIRNEGEHVTE
jgi:hypothetical protein